MIRRPKQDFVTETGAGKEWNMPAANSLPSIAKRTFIAYVEDEFCMLNRVASLFRRCNFNIESLIAGGNRADGYSSSYGRRRRSNESGVCLVKANLYKFVNVFRVDGLTNKPALACEFDIVKVKVMRKRHS